MSCSTSSMHMKSSSWPGLLASLCRLMAAAWLCSMLRHRPRNSGKAIWATCTPGHLRRLVQPAHMGMGQAARKLEACKGSMPAPLLSLPDEEHSDGFGLHVAVSAALRDSLPACHLHTQQPAQPAQKQAASVTYPPPSMPQCPLPSVQAAAGAQSQQGAGTQPHARDRGGQTCSRQEPEAEESTARLHSTYMWRRHCCRNVRPALELGRSWLCRLAQP